MSKYIEKNVDHDGVDRRGFLKCMAWAGTGALCVMQGGVLKSFALTDVLQQKVGNLKGDLSFVQISDSHIGFSKPANPDVTGTLREAIAKINALPTPPAFVLHTGDLTHLSKPEEFDTLAESLKEFEDGTHLLRSGRARRAQRQRGGISRTIRQGRAGRGVVQLRQPRRAFYGIGERAEFEGGRVWATWARRSGSGLKKMLRD